MNSYDSRMWEEVKVECMACGKVVVDQRISLLDDGWRWKEDKETDEAKKAFCSSCFKKSEVEIKRE